MTERDEQSLRDVLRAARQILGYTSGKSREILASNAMCLDAVLYELVVIGEAARRLSPELREASSDIPWREIIGMRSVITHDYDHTDEDELWLVIERDLPLLIGQLERLLSCS
jgi:uncharacterized protein with HEPN domain